MENQVSQTVDSAVTQSSITQGPSTQGIAPSEAAPEAAVRRSRGSRGPDSSTGSDSFRQPVPQTNIPVRRISFEESLKDLPRYFAEDGDLLQSHMMAAFSSVFPDGEDFFVRSVRRFRDRITDPELRSQVSDFVRQEAMHGREHRVLNQRLQELGYPTLRLEKATREDLERVEREESDLQNLALTAALEHFTATFAEAMLEAESEQASVTHPAVRDLLLWHAIEECEHKSVAFDVYKAMGGSESMRVKIMNRTCVRFIFGMSFSTLASVLADPNTYRGGNLLRSLRRIGNVPFLRRRTWERLRDYNRPDFHPEDHDTEALLARWREELFGAEGRLSHMAAEVG